MESTSAAAAPASALSSSSVAPASTSAVPPSSLFNNDENRFLQDTLASAHSFDPFQHGAPGFKVPAVLPPGLIQGMAANGNSSGSWPMQQHQDNSVFSAFPVPDRSRTNSWAPGGTHDSSPVQGNNESFVAFVRRTQGNTPFSTSTSSQSPPAHAPTQYHHQHSQSFSGPSTGGGGAYGQNMAWKMQQLEALQAERRRYMESVGGNTGTSGPPRDASASTVSPMDYQSMAHPPPPTSDAGPSGSSPAMSAHSRHPSHQSPPHPNPHASAADLSTLGLSFPSSHDFPAATPPDGGGDQQMAGMYPHQHQQHLPHLHHHSPPPAPSLRGPIHRLKSGNGGGRSSGSNSSGSSSGSRARHPSASGSAGAKAAADAQQTTAEYKPWPKAPSPSAPSTSYPPVHVDPSLVSRSLLSSNASLSRHADAFYGREPAEERRHFQPHLVDLKDRRREERKKKAEMMEEKKAKALARQKAAAQDDTQADESEQDDDGNGSGEDDEEGGKKRNKSSSSANGAKKPAHTLLTEAEKKANHIASEQKRRANIRKGYELLCQGVPALREALERGEEAGGSGSGGLTSNDSMPTLEIGGEKIDGRAGPRSEAVVLGKSVEHLRHLLEVHRDLRSRRDHARVKLARARFGIDVVVKEDPNAVAAQAQSGGKTGAKGKKAAAAAAAAAAGKKKAGSGNANGKEKGKGSSAPTVKVEEGQTADEGNSMDVS